MAQITLKAPAKSHLLNVVQSLLAVGWTIETSPREGQLLRNGQKVMLKSDRVDLRFRLFVYKVTGSSRGRPEERRIEITSTYPKGLPRLSKFSDIVLGYDPNTAVYVGVDPQRIEHGGSTGNASSFFDRKGLVKRERIALLQRKAALFVKGIEYHAFLDATRLPEYFFNLDEIHSGTYLGDGFSPARQGREAPHIREDFRRRCARRCVGINCSAIHEAESSARSRQQHNRSV